MVSFKDWIGTHRQESIGGKTFTRLPQGKLAA
jgi:hypothetical protein